MSRQLFASTHLYSIRAGGRIFFTFSQQTPPPGHDPFLSSPQIPLLLISNSTFSLIKEKNFLLHNKPLF